MHLLQRPLIKFAVLVFFTFALMQGAGRIGMGLATHVSHQRNIELTGAITGFYLYLNFTINLFSQVRKIRSILIKQTVDNIAGRTDEITIRSADTAIRTLSAMIGKD